jgi:uncharacterized protein (TIGR02099 family)
LEKPPFKRLANTLKGCFFIVVAMLAIYVSVGRTLTANVAGFRTEILQALNKRAPFIIEARQVSGEWRLFSPVIVLTDLRLSFPGSSNPPLALSEGRISLDVINSLRTRSLRLTRIVLADLSMRGELSDQGVLRLAGFEGDSGESAEQLQALLLNVELIILRNNRLTLTMPSGEVRDLGLDLQLSRDGSFRHVAATLSSSRGARIVVLAQGVGDPFQPERFSGQVYLNLHSTDLGAVKDLLSDSSLPLWADGAVDLQLWLNWDRGDTSLAAQLEGHDLLVAEQNSAWQLPLQRVALQGQLQQSGDRWSLFVSDMQVEQDGVELTLPRLQLDRWDNGLRIRASDLPLEPINAIISRQEAVPEALREVLIALHPRGLLPSLQARIGDMEHPADDWQVEANFASLAVESIHGAPGITSGTGYTNITPGRGLVVIDSQLLTLDFPAIYREPLHFDDLYGTLHLDWDDDTFRLASGLLTTQAEEGTAKVLFGLNIPLVPDDNGIEMDLLVGLQNSHPIHRDKYIPNLLDPSLRNWLSDSIGEGRIEQGAFLWRGSLKPGAAPLRRTIQLAFNVADTQLSYHPEWPAVLVRQGIVLIDDSAVSVWADRASLFQSNVERLSVETRVNTKKQITLALAGKVLGPADDGLRVLNESPLARTVGAAFADWTATGSLETDVALRMNLSEKSVLPEVDVATRCHDVNLLVMPGNLAVQAVNGEIAYSTSRGISSTALTGELWGETVSAILEQSKRAPGESYDPASSVVDVKLAAEVDMADVREWLHLEHLAFVSGRTAAEVGIRLASGAPPLITASSELRGVSIDLPRPWKKNSDEAQTLELEIPLTSGGMPLSLDLGEQLKFRLNIADGKVRSGVLGINAEPSVAQEGVLLVAGHTPLIQGDEWLEFFKKYFGGAGSETPQLSEEPMPSPAVVAPEGSLTAGSDGHQADPAVVPFAVVIDRLRADTLVILQQELRDVVLSLMPEQAGSSLSLTSDWLRGTLFVSRADGPSRLQVEHLDLDRVPDFKLPDSGSKSAQDLPVVDVVLRNLFKTGQRLGELSFVLHGQGGEFTAEKITGELASLRLTAARPGRLVWHRGEPGHTEFQANLDFDDLGQSLEYFDYQRVVETVGGNLQVQLRWPGAPQDFSLREGQGIVQVKIGQGSFLEATPGATGALRVVSILNLAEIVRRLSLSHMFGSGIPFDTVNGEIALSDGMLEVARMEVKGSSSFQFSGVSDVEKKSLEGKLVATLPLASNLPWIAAVAASLPVAAGVYVVSKVFDKQMKLLSSAVYTVGGSWDDPEVSFDHIFENTVKPPAQLSTTTSAQSGSP